MNAMRRNRPHDRRLKPQLHQLGFTLIELMVTVAVVAALAAFAVPQYKDYVMRSRLADAQGTLAAFSTSLQQFYQDNRTFVNACGNTGVGALPAATTYFVFSCDTVSATTIRALATGQGAAANFQFSIDQDGNRVTLNAPTGWATNSSCWIRNPSGTCN